MIDSLLNNVLGRLEEATGRSPKPSGTGYTSNCPAHDDTNPSLSIGEGDDGRVLLCCHAGCSVEDVCESLGMTTAELFPETVSTSTQPPDYSQRRRFRRHGSPQLFDSEAEAIETLEVRHGPASASWPYSDASGSHVMTVLRFEQPDGKTFRPVSRRGDKWTIGGMQGPRPLYHLNELSGADVVYITEGEKAADAVRSLGLTATTSSGGSDSARWTDWRPLAGKTVVILPDNDPAGEEYARDVARILGGLA